MPPTEDDRSAMARAWGLGSQVTTIALEMVIPGILGLWIDQALGTVMLFLILGVIFGMTAGMIHLVRFAKQVGEQGGRRPEDDRDDSSEG